MNAYRALIERQQKEISASKLLGYAFGNEQFRELMDRWGLDMNKREDLKQVTGLGGTGAFIQKKDLQAYKDLRRKHREELKVAIDADSTGDGFVYQMFYAELADHEYGYTEDLQEALEYLPFSYDEIIGDPALKHGLERAAGELAS